MVHLLYKEARAGAHEMAATRESGRHQFSPLKGYDEKLSLQQFPLRFTDEDMEQRFQEDNFRFMYPLHMLTLLVNSVLVGLLPGERLFLSVFEPNDWHIALESLVIPLLCMALRTYVHHQGDAPQYHCVYTLGVVAYVIAMALTVVSASWIAAFASNVTRNHSLFQPRQIITGEVEPLAWCLLTLIFLSMWVSVAISLRTTTQRLLVLFPVNAVGPLIAPLFSAQSTWPMLPPVRTQRLRNGAPLM